MNDVFDEYQTIKKDTKVEKFGMVIKIMYINPLINACDYPYIVVFAPLYKDGTFNEDEYVTFGGSVGYSTSEFKTQKEAETFYNDILNLTSHEMATKYPMLWCEQEDNNL